MNQAVPPSVIERKRAQPFYLQLWFLVLVAMVLGIALGHFYPDAGVRMEPLGDAFIKAIRVLIAPIIFARSCMASPTWPISPKSAASR
jgi:aerobic C4-dicarboxylate transport protein